MIRLLNGNKAIRQHCFTVCPMNQNCNVPRSGATPRLKQNGPQLFMRKKKSDLGNILDIVSDP